jgi:hypothetical protein
MQVLEQGCMVGVGDVGAPDAAGEDGIATKQVEGLRL